MIILVKEGSKSTTRKGARIWGDKVRRRVDDNKMLLMNRVADGLPPSRLVVCGTKDLVVDFFASSMCALLSKALTVFSPSRTKAWTCMYEVSTNFHPSMDHQKCKTISGERRA